MTIEINDALREKIIAFCNDELDYHITECCATDYHDEILAQIEILFLLGEVESARQYAFEYGNEVMCDMKQVEMQQEIHELLNRYPTDHIDKEENK